VQKQDTNIVFKDYDNNQLMLLPQSLEELLPLSHPARTVNSIIDRINMGSILDHYSTLGASSYHPKMLMKVLIYGYLDNCFSSRKIEKSIKESIPFMWLAGMQRPDHNTINRFRSAKLNGVIREVFSQVVLLLHDEGLLDIKDIYTDGTKIEANANRYTFVWGNTIKTNKEKISSQLQQLWDYAKKVATQELEDQPEDFKNPSPEKVIQTVDKINKALEGKKADKKVRQKLNYAKRNWPEKLQEYAKKEEILQGRNSFSKTDEGSTFMRMKEDHMKNGQLKPGYNLQLSTSKQFVVNYSVHQNPGDTITLKPHLETYKSMFGHHPDTVTADAGYGSEENYDYLEKNGVDAYVKFNTFHKELRDKKKRKKTFTLFENLHYNQEDDTYTCPIGQKMTKINQVHRKTSTGYIQQYTYYMARNCQGCPLAGSCKKGAGNKILKINKKLEEYRNKARAKLTSETGIQKRKQRATDVEPVFGHFKQNKGLKRYALRGLEKVEIETGLAVIAHNLEKASRK
jgi:transposase